MANVTVVVDSDLSLELTEEIVTLLKLFNTSGLRHPRTLQPDFLGNEIALSFSKTGTVQIYANGTHLWQYADDPSLVFDDRGLG